ncbi:hypothetical protein [Kurthia huakuii]|uniref:hypothetical protein n=1 Tax=Kurthia huakuii TaxID=1421019 RepID=UPI000494EB41|nr:hypothetical protein [Kurthia huakuii]MBM7699718.1 hypothetical protein [Kurthia huakuii]
MYLLGIIAFISAFLMIALFSYLFADKVELALDGLTEEEENALLEQREQQQRLLWRTSYVILAIFVIAIALIFTQSLLRYYQ